jgi:hypothetical protein
MQGAALNTTSSTPSESHETGHPRNSLKTERGNGPIIRGSGKIRLFCTSQVRDPDKPLKDKLHFCLLNGQEFTSLVHYEWVVQFCTYCTKLNHKVETAHQE